MPFTAQQVADECVRQTKTNRIHNRAVQVALVAIMLAPSGAVDAETYRKAVSRECRKRYGSLLLLIVLPILVNLITAWIMKWLNNRDFPLATLQAQAKSAL
jgi:hypothetical protein